MSTEFIPAVRVAVQGPRVVVFRLSDMKPLIEVDRTDTPRITAVATLFHRVGLFQEEKTIDRSLRV